MRYRTRFLIGATLLASAATGLWWALLQVQAGLGNKRTPIPPLPVIQWWPTGAAIVGGLVFLLIVLYAPSGDGEPAPKQGWSTARLTTAFHTAQLTKPGDDGQPPAVALRATHATDDATILVVKLPAGLVVSNVAGRREYVAAALGLPTDRLHIGAHEGRADMLALTVDAPPLTLSSRAPILPDATRWNDPILLGRDMRGRDVRVSTWDVPQWLIGGQSGYGKTVAFRMIIAHYAADPDAVLWGVDGKGNRDDWSTIQPRFERWVTVLDRVNGPARYLQMLEDLALEIDRRQDVEGRDYPGMLVLLDDAPQLRKRLAPDDKSRADDLLTGIVQTCRAANVLILVAAQKPSSKQMDTDQRSQSGIALCMRMENLDDARMVLGSRPPDSSVLSFPRGDGWLKSGDEPLRRVRVDFLTNQKWKQLSTELAARWVVDVVPEAIADAPAVEVEPEPQDVDPLLRAAYDVVAASPEGRMTTAEILAELPPGMADGVRALGKTLSDLGWRPRAKERVGKASFSFRYAVDAPFHDATQDTEQVWNAPASVL